MKKLTEEEILHNWNELIRIINESFSGERKEKILKLHEYFENRMSIAPASGKEHYHCAYPGGYVEHILGVINGAKKLKAVWEEVGCDIDFAEENLVFAALFHDLGKVGTMDADYFIPQEDEWRRKKMSEIYMHNPNIDFMTATDRTWFLLSQFDIKYTETEFIAIHLADGLYNEYNKTYMITYDKNHIIKSNLPHIIHAADFMAMHSEYDAWKKSKNEEEGDTDNVDVKKYRTKKNIVDAAKAAGDDSKLKDYEGLFNELFDNKPKEEK